MRHSVPIAPQFYVTAPQPCPYLQGQIERKLFTALHGQEAQSLNDALSKQGFRRSQNILYRPSCTECMACMSARIRVGDIKFQRSQRRNIRRNLDIVRNVKSPWATEEQYNLFRRYVEARHANGGMADMDMFEFAAMVEETPIETKVVEYRNRNTDQLAAVCLTDVLDDGLSLVYSFFDPDEKKRGFGIYMILDHVGLARDLELPYVYLGYWVQGSPKMDYKSRFNGVEIYTQSRWQPLNDPSTFQQSTESLCNDSVSEQLANIMLSPTD